MITATWSAPANIALIKYWGKLGVQIPANPSISMTLEKSRTVTQVSLPKELKPGEWVYTYEEKPKAEFEEKIQLFLDRTKHKLPFLMTTGVAINSSNNFPHSSGISSSASFYASLAMGLCELNNKILKADQNQTAFIQSASEIARLGSGSAARSVIGGYAVWGKTDLIDSADEYAVSLRADYHPVFQSYRDAILIVSSETKPLSSSSGHALMNQNPYAETRYELARQHLGKLIRALKEGDQDSFIEIVEHEALSLHGLIMSSLGGTLLLKPGTLEIINQVRQYRDQTGSKACFTLDAGPNIHLLYPESEKTRLHEFIRTKLAVYCENKHWIDDEIGSGPRKEPK